MIYELSEEDLEVEMEMPPAKRVAGHLLPTCNYIVNDINKFAPHIQALLFLGSICFELILFIFIHYYCFLLLFINWELLCHYISNICFAFYLVIVYIRKYRSVLCHSSISFLFLYLRLLLHLLHIRFPN